MSKIIIQTGRRIGKSWLNRQILEWEVKYGMQEFKIVWEEKSPLVLVATLRMMPRGYELGLTEVDVYPLQEWCQEHNCGIRTSFDTFKFKNKKEKTMFLLRWGS